MARVGTAHGRDRSRVARYRQPVAHRIADDPASWQVEAARPRTRRSTGDEEDDAASVAQRRLDTHVEPRIRPAQVLPVQVDRPIWHDGAGADAPVPTAVKCGADRFGDPIVLSLWKDSSRDRPSFDRFGTGNVRHDLPHRRRRASTPHRRRHASPRERLFRAETAHRLSIVQARPWAATGTPCRAPTCRRRSSAPRFPHPRTYRSGSHP